MRPTKTTSFAAARALFLVALVFAGLSAVPATHAQDLGDLLNKAKGAGKGAEDGVGKSDPSDAAPSGGGRAENIVFAQKQVADALRRIAPKGAALLIVSCKANSGKPYSYTTACLIASPTGQKSAVSVPIPASVNASFAAFHDNYQKNGYGREAWDVCRVSCRSVKEKHSATKTGGSSTMALSRSAGSRAMIGLMRW